MPSRRPTRVPFFALLTACSCLPITVFGQAQESASSLRERGTLLAYNLDHEQALVLLRRAVDLAPDDPATHRTLANVLWLNMLFRRGAVTVDHYLGSLTRSNIDLKKPPPELDAEFRQQVARALELAEQRVAAQPKSAQAHYDLGAALGLQASYIATVEGRLMAGFKAARRSYDEHERVLQLDPARKDAGLIVGTYRYIVSTLSLPMRWMAYVAGFGGGRDRGIQMLVDTAKFGSDNRADALFALVLVYNREHRYDEALRAIADLRQMFPRNRLLLLEGGSTALRGNRAQQADQLLTEGMTMLAGDTRPKFPGEIALWHYKRGAARVAVGRLDDALTDLRAAAATGDAAAWVQGRTHVELGRVAVKRGEHDRAADEAREALTLCDTGRDQPCLDDARALLRSSHGR